MTSLYLNDLDPQLIKSIGLMYSSDNLPKGDTVPLQFFLEEAIKAKSGVSKDLTLLVSSAFQQRQLGEYKPFINAIEESKGSNSDNELELDLFKEDLMCVICNGMDVGARNRLLECSGCHMLYHQECHKPVVTPQDSFDTWVCQSCKDKNANNLTDPSTIETPTTIAVPAGIVTTVAATPPVTTVLSPITTTTTPPVIATTSTPLTNSHIKTTPSSSPTKSGSSNRHGSSHKSSKSDKYSKSSSNSPSSKSLNSQKLQSSSSSASSSSSRSNVTPNINIISADKRIQIMKKKAAKLQEKRKHSTR